MNRYAALWLFSGITFIAVAVARTRQRKAADGRTHEEKVDRTRNYQGENNFLRQTHESLRSAARRSWLPLERISHPGCRL